MRNRLYTFFLCLITLFAGCTRGQWLDEIVAQRDEQEEVVPILRAAKEKGLTVDSAEEIERTNKYYTVDTANGYYNEFKRYRVVFSDQTTVEFDVLGQLNGVQSDYYTERGLSYISEVCLSDIAGDLYIWLAGPDSVGGSLSFRYTPEINDPNDNITYEKLTIVEFLAVPEDASVYYELTGVITNVINTHYGNFYLVDDTGEVFVYGLIDKDGNLCYSNYGLKNGDTITIRGRRSSYNGEPQMTNAVYVSHIVGSDEDVDAIENRKIYYTSTDRMIVTPNATDVFGANIISNTYKHGLGVITFDGNVTSIGDSAFGSCSSLASVTIPDSVTSIGEGAFSACTSLASITIPEGVTSIGEGTFSGCSSLASVTIPEGVTSIDSWAFEKCSSLVSITIPEEVTWVGSSAFTDCTSLASVYCKPKTPPTTNVSQPPFDNNASGRKIYVPEESVEAYKSSEWWSEYADAFVPYDFEKGEVVNLESRKIYYTSTDGNVVTPYATNVFGAKIISNTYENGQGVITFDGEVTTIGIDAFRECTSLKSVSIPGGVIEIVGAFWGCSSLTSITIPNSVTMIGDNSFFNCSSLTSVTIPNSITRIRGHAFWGCTSLTSITIPNSVTLIGEYAFANCTSLTSFYSKFASKDGRCLIVGGELNSFAPAGLTEYIIPNSITSIGTFAFYSCSLLTSITIPSGVTSIEWAAFDICTSLASVYCKPTVPPSGNYHMFTGNASGRKIYVPAESVEAYKTAQYWSDYADDIVGYSF